ncbi:MAG TPA: peptidylprolyl isomerase [Alphaproteobacteria bacterium]|jgi:peptidylprolyl isomerase|nr:peptidylprolyl isomerase [Alphaproteobacteria bacterium]
MRLLPCLAAFLFLAVSAFGQTPAPIDEDPDNVLIMELKDGPVVIRMRPDLAPNHVKRIKELVRQGFYDGLTFHRVIPGALVQGGDPKGTGEGGSGKMLKAEFSSEPHMRGTVSMARAEGNDSADSQFFICLKPSPDFNRRYTVWGKVIRGMEFVNHIETGDPESGRVSNPDHIVSMRIEGDPPRSPAAAKSPEKPSKPAKSSGH